MDIIQIYETTDYDSIKAHPMQRPVSLGHVKKLAKEIKRNNRLRSNPGVLDKNGYLVDGQHRLAAAVLLEVPFYYRIDSLSIDEVRTENATVMKWSYIDYVESYAAQGLESYVFLLDFINNHPALPPSLCIKIITRGMGSSFKDGTLNVSEEKRKRVNAFANLLDSFIEISDNFSHPRIISALYSVINNPDYDHKRMIAKCKSSPRSVVLCANQSQAVEMLQEIYNHGLSKKNRVNWL